MATILTRMTTTVGENHCLDLHVPNIPIGEIEVIIVKRDQPAKHQDILFLLPRHQLGRVKSSLRRKENNRMNGD